MSRTYRKTKRRVPEWVTEDYGWNPVYYTRKFKGVELKESIAKYHSDKPSGYNNAPSVFRRDVNRIFRSKMNMVTKMITINGEYDDYNYGVFKHNCNWYYW